MWKNNYLSRIDFRVIPLILALMVASLLVISSHSQSENNSENFFTPIVRTQIQWFILGWIAFFFCAVCNYNKLREWAWIFYAFMLVALLGLFFTDPIQRVNRWYRIPFLNIGFQPSEVAKLAVLIALSWFLERRKMQARDWSTAFCALIIVGIPFLLILKQPDLDSALILLPMALVMAYFGDLRPSLVKSSIWLVALSLCLVALIFLGTISHENLRPYATKVLKTYQFDRFDPNTHHQKSAATAIALGGITGTGWNKGTFSREGWLPTPYTDAIFPAFAEEFGLIGVICLLGLFYALIYCSFQVTAVATNHFGRLLSAGIAVYLVVHVLINVGMMSGFFPITGVPLPLMSYGGTFIIVTMAALGILQSIYSRRFMFYSE